MSKQLLEIAQMQSILKAVMKNSKIPPNGFINSIFIAKDGSILDLF